MSPPWGGGSRGFWGGELGWVRRALAAGELNAWGRRRGDPEGNRAPNVCGELGWGVTACLFATSREEMGERSFGASLPLPGVFFFPEELRLRPQDRSEEGVGNPADPFPSVFGVKTTRDLCVWGRRIPLRDRLS